MDLNLKDKVAVNTGLLQKGCMLFYVPEMKIEQWQRL